MMGRYLRQAAAAACRAGCEFGGGGGPCAARCLYADREDADADLVAAFDAIADQFERDEAVAELIMKEGLPLAAAVRLRRALVDLMRHDRTPAPAVADFSTWRGAKP